MGKKDSGGNWRGGDVRNLHPKKKTKNSRREANARKRISLPKGASSQHQSSVEKEAEPTRERGRLPGERKLFLSYAEKENKEMLSVGKNSRLKSKEKTRPKRDIKIHSLEGKST